MVLSLNNLVKQEKAAMKIGTDAVILGPTKTNADTFSVLDIGAGTGVIALMLAQNLMLKL